jgi:hypothetical protein
VNGDAPDALDRRLTRLEVQFDAFLKASLKQAEADERLHAAHDELIRKLDTQLDTERDARRDSINLEREARTAAIAVEREARIASITVETAARQALASDLRVFSTRIFVGVGVVIFAAQLILSIFGPSLRHALGVPT